MKNAPEEVEETDGFDDHSEKGVLNKDEHDPQQETECCRVTPVSFES